MTTQSLMEIGIPADNRDGVNINPQQDHGGKLGDTEVIFRNIKERLIEVIETSDQEGLILGAVAWLTDYDVLEALARKNSAIVVQKEDFLRPDIAARPEWAAMLRQKYEAVQPGDWNRYDLPGIASELSVCGNPGIEGAGITSSKVQCGVRCVGNHNADKAPAWPRMHNKFLVFMERKRVGLCNCWDVWYPHRERGEEFQHYGGCDGNTYRLASTSLWTGSFNLTRNARMSFENALYITDSRIAALYANEWAQIYALSEPLDWETPWVAPEFRVGT